MFAKNFKRKYMGFNLHQQMFLKDTYKQLKEELKSEVIYYDGAIYFDFINLFIDFISNIKKHSPNYDTISIIIKTDGGHGAAIETMVNVLYDNYSRIRIIVQDRCLSAGTILALSSNEIYMNDYSRLGAIDSYLPKSDGTYYPLTLQRFMYKELLAKDENKTMTPYERHILGKMDIVTIKQYEYEDELISKCIKKWLCERMFIDNNEMDKEAVSNKIVEKLIDITYWKSHSKGIYYKDLKNEFPELNLENYQKNESLFYKIGSYCNTLSNRYYKSDLFIHSEFFQVSESIKETNDNYK